MRSNNLIPNPGPIAVADFNGDGKLDVASVGTFDTEVSVLLGNGDGTFQPPVLYPADSEPVSIAAGDLNHDGRVDLVVGNQLSGDVSVLLGNGDGTFQAPANYPLPALGGAIWIGLGDFNNDGNLDIVAIDALSGCGSGSGQCVVIFLGNGDGTFRTPPVITTFDTDLYEFAIGDFNNDGKLDLVVTDAVFATAQFQILLGNGNGTFQVGAAYPYFGHLGTGYLNRDRNLDLVISGGGLDVFLGNGDGTFQGPTVYSSLLNWLAVADFNGDGIADVVATEANTGRQVVIFYGNGDGTFQSPKTFATSSDPGFLVAADFNRDHQPDLVAATGKYPSYYLTVTLNTGPVTLSPTTPLNFGKQSVGTTSPPKVVTLTNSGKSTLTISSMKTMGPFALTSTCGSTVATGATCSISVTFSPTSTGLKSGTVTIQDSASSKPQVIALSGIGD